MTRRNSRRALLSSILSLVLCCSMLIGTTFAWFTDSVTSTNNIIKSGNLDIELYYQNDETSDWTKVDATTNVFKVNTLWEPGHTEVVKLKVVNEGTLALKYQLGVNVASETGSFNMAGEAFKLSDHIQFAIIEGEQTYTREQAVAAAEGKSTALKQAYSSGSTKLYSKADAQADATKASETVVTMVVYMPTSVGNEANYGKGQTVPQINLGLNLFATQYTYEKDSFDENYDKGAVAFSVAELLPILAANENGTLQGADEPTEILWIPEGYTGIVTLQDSTIQSVQEGSPTSGAALDDDATATTGGATLVIKGNVVMEAEVEGMSAITGKNINIVGDGHLTAIGKGKAAFGIGGMNTETISIKGITIDYVEGGCAGEVGSDTKYYKDAPEGGAAIGSGYDGAVITLEDVTITSAVGGSKAAGIGARYWTGVTVNIKDSEIAYVEGGVSAAGIGGSRISGDASESGVIINIDNSTINAKGGAYGAGIGSGYDTHCLSSQPMCTLNITDSTITAQGGQYAAGVGTGYHHAALSGEIKNTTVNAASGEKFYKDAYTLAMDVGFGVVDPAREGQQTSSKLIYNGTTIRFFDMETAATTEDLKAALAAGKNVELTEDLSFGSGVIMLNGGLLDGGNHEVAFTSGSSTKSVLGTTGGTIQNIKVNGSGKSVQGIGAGMTTANPLTQDLYLENVTVDNVMYAVIGTAQDGVKVVVTDSKLYGAFSYIGAKAEVSQSTLGAGKSMMAFFEVSADAIFAECAFEDGYCFMAYDTAAGSTVTFTNCTVEGTALTADNFQSLLVDTRWDNSSELCSANLKDCTIIVDGATVTW